LRQFGTITSFQNRRSNHLAFSQNLQTEIEPCSFGSVQTEFVLV